MNANPQASAPDPARLRRLRVVGVLSGFAAGAWLGAAEAPAKLVTAGVSPVVVSLAMVYGVFLARWSLPALIQGMAAVGADVRQAPHLVVWAVLAGCLWAVANTLTIFAIRDIGLSIAFPLWNTNSLLGILWGVLFFNELRGAGRTRWAGVVGGALVMCVGATLLAIALASQATTTHAVRGITAALAAGLLWGTMYIPYRKAYLSGISPLAFVTFFTIGELGMMTGLAVTYSGGPALLWRDITGARDVLFWLLLGGFVWVVGDLFQQYAAKYVGISRGIPLSNTNQLWGLLWGLLVFGELERSGGNVYGLVIGGSLVMALGAGAIALAAPPEREHEWWREAARKEAARYDIDPAFVEARLAGTDSRPVGRRGPLDWLVVSVATAVFVGLGAIARVPDLAFDSGWALALIAAMVAFLVYGGRSLWRTTRFH